MRRFWSIFATAVLLMTAVPSRAQVPTAEQLELLRSMSPEDRSALMEQLGLGDSVVDDRGASGQQQPRLRPQDSNVNQDLNSPASREIAATL